MSVTGDRAASSPVAALHLVASLLGEVETATPSSAFYGRLAEAVCRLGSMRRAVVWVYDDVRRRVRPAGAHGLDLGIFDGRHQRVESAPIAERALAQDQVLEASGDLTAELPPIYVERLEIHNVTCIPISAGGTGFGVVLAERETEAALTGPERETLWMLGKVCALAASTREATRQQERAHQLADRLDLAREIHEGVVQRLFGISLVLEAPGELGTRERRRCADELRGALADLRLAMQRPPATVLPAPETSLSDELERLAERHADLGLRVRWDEGAEVPPSMEALAQAVVTEAVRNAHKHATPTHIDVVLAPAEHATTLEVINDGVPADAPQAAGMGLRLTAFEALGHGAAFDFGRTPPDRWHVRLVMPLPVTP